MRFYRLNNPFIRKTNDWLIGKSALWALRVDVEKTLCYWREKARERQILNIVMSLVLLWNSTTTERQLPESPLKDLKPVKLYGRGLIITVISVDYIRGDERRQINHRHLLHGRWGMLNHKVLIVPTLGTLRRASLVFVHFLLWIERDIKR